MIDKIKLAKYADISSDVFFENKFKTGYSSKSNSVFYYKVINRVYIWYFPSSCQLIINGRIIGFFKNDIGRVKNFDDLVIDTGLPLEEIFNTVENNIKKAFFNKTMCAIDFCLDDFDVTYIEFCINCDVGDQTMVEAYIKMLNLLYIIKGDSRYKNFVFEEKKEFHSSLYIKPNNKYEKNTRTGSTINFYNKHNQLSKESKRGYTSEGIELQKKSVEESKGVLRLEVQLGSQVLHQLRKSYGLSKRFKEYKCLNFAYDLISRKVKYFFGDGELCSFKVTKNIIVGSELSDKLKENLIKKYGSYSKLVGQQSGTYTKVKNSFTKYYEKIIKSLGITPVPIPSKWNIDRLANPIDLIERKRKILHSIITDKD
ncbi:MAG: hypothetical protein AB1Z19_09595 [Eubacteriales bacterium]